MPKKTIKSGEKIPTSLSVNERDLILNQTFVDNNITDPLQQAIPEENLITIHLSLEDLDDLLGYIAAEANHAKNKKLEEELDELFDKLEMVLEEYIEEE